MRSGVRGETKTETWDEAKTVGIQPVKVALPHKSCDVPCIEQIKAYVVVKT